MPETALGPPDPSNRGETHEEERTAYERDGLPTTWPWSEAWPDRAMYVDEAAKNPTSDDDGKYGFTLFLYISYIRSHMRFGYRMLSICRKRMMAGCVTEAELSSVAVGCNLSVHI